MVKEICSTLADPPSSRFHRFALCRLITAFELSNQLKVRRSTWQRLPDHQTAKW